MPPLPDQISWVIWSGGGGTFLMKYGPNSEIWAPYIKSKYCTVDLLFRQRYLENFNLYFQIP
jgi:hypothetical protein